VLGTAQPDDAAGRRFAAASVLERQTTTITMISPIATMNHDSTIPTIAIVAPNAVSTGR
jgi:hypothetical protein